MKWKVVIGVLIIVVIGVSVIYQQNIRRLYTAITLYDQDKIVENFLTMPESFNANKIAASDTPSREALIRFHDNPDCVLSILRFCGG